MKGCATIEESLQSLIDAAKLYSKQKENDPDGSSFYPTMYHYTMIRYLKLVKKKAKFSFNPDQCFTKPTLNWDVDE